MRRMFSAVFASLAALAIALTASGGTARAQEATGETQFNNSCRTCHSVKEGDNRLGPNLHGIIGRKSGAAEGFAYSASMKQAGITWDEVTLDKFITNPDSVVPSNNMKPYTGVSDAAVRKQIIEFLKADGKQ